MTEEYLAYIPISKTEMAIVDFDSLCLVLDYTWCKSGPGYAHARVKGLKNTNKNILMHRLLCKGAIIDHINGDKLDNRVSNLRPITKQQNALNTHKQRGVYRRADKFIAAITIGGKFIHLGVYSSYAEAAEARNKKQEEFFVSKINIHTGDLP